MIQWQRVAVVKFDIMGEQCWGFFKGTKSDSFLC